LKAVSPQACISDFFFDDFHHNGAYLLSYWKATPLFGIQNRTHNKGGIKCQIWGLKTITNFSRCRAFVQFRYYGKDNEFWQQLKDHSSYDDFGKERFYNTKDIKPAVMTVGGF
jgi:hypothetical protein